MNGSLPSFTKGGNARAVIEGDTIFEARATMRPSATEPRSTCRLGGR